MKKALIVAGFYMAMPFLALAQTDPGSVTSVTTLYQKILYFLNLAVPLAIAIAVVIFIYGVLKYVTAGEDEDKSKARNFMIWGIVAIFVMVSVWGLVNILKNTFGLQNNVSIPTSVFPSGYNPTR
jgi:uncharacterized membrane protein YidH (DUF202 family)